MNSVPRSHLCMGREGRIVHFCLDLEHFLFWEVEIYMPVFACIHTSVYHPPNHHPPHTSPAWSPTSHPSTHDPSIHLPTNPAPFTLTSTLLPNTYSRTLIHPTHNIHILPSTQKPFTHPVHPTPTQPLAHPPTKTFAPLEIFPWLISSFTWVSYQISLPQSLP
jgi:hypothetical protein